MATRKPKQTTPKLLSGGNPQIAKADGDAPVQAYIAAMPGWKRDVGRHVDALVDRAAPGARRAVRWNSPFWGMPDRGWFLSIHCLTKYVKLTWLNGASLDPEPPLAGKDPHARFLHVFEGDAMDDEQLERWIRQAARLPGEELFR